MYQLPSYFDTDIYLHPTDSGMEALFNCLLPHLHNILPSMPSSCSDVLLQQFAPSPVPAPSPPPSKSPPAIFAPFEAPAQHASAPSAHSPTHNYTHALHAEPPTAHPPPTIPQGASAHSPMASAPVAAPVYTNSRSPKSVKPAASPARQPLAVPSQHEISPSTLVPTPDGTILAGAAWQPVELSVSPNQCTAA